MKKDIKIVFIGDDNVGKSSIILSSVNGEFVENPQKIVPEMIVSGESQGVSCTTHIIDTCSSDEVAQGGRAQLQLELKRSDAIVLVYSYERFNDSFFSIRTKWLPLLQQLNLQQPLVIVGNKIDKITQEELDQLQQQVIETLNYIATVYRGTLRWLQTSARNMININELMESTQNLLIFPEEPLYNRQASALTPDCERALRRIFSLCDIDNDGILNDYEINYFQQRCVNQPMSPEEIATLRQFIGSQLESGVRSDGFTAEGFLLMHLLFLAKGSQQTWLALRAFQYDDSLQLAEEYIHPSLNVRQTEVVELSEDGIDFIHKIFKRYDSNSDGLLSDSDLEQMFSITPGIPFGADFKNTVELGRNKELGIRSMVCLFQMLTNKDYRTTLEYFAYLGYNSVLHSSTSHLVSICKKSSPNKSVFNIYVLGSSVCGKSTFMNTFANQDSSSHSTPTKGHKKVCSVFNQKYIIYHEFIDGEGLVQEPKTLNRCDAVILMFDESVNQSFDYASKIYKTLSQNYSNIPVYFVRGHQSTQDSETSPHGKYFSEIKHTPIEFHINRSAEEYEEIISKILKGIQVTLGKQQSQSTSTTSRSSNSTKSNEGSSNLVPIVALGVAACAVAGFLVMKNMGKTT